MIRRILFAALFLGLTSGLACASEKDAGALFSDAVSAYHAAHYDKAVALNEAILAKGFSSPALYYNLGNSYLKSRHLGRSILNYLRASGMSPRDSDLKSNLAFARSLVENYSPWPHSSVLSLPGKDLTEEELQWVAFAAFALTGIFWLAGLFVGLPQKRIVLGTGFLAILTAYLVASSFCQVIENGSKAVAVARAEARFEPSPQATAYFKIPEGTELKVLREKDGWFKIERSDGKMGWVPATPLERL